MDGEGIYEPAANLPKMSEGEEVVEDYIALRLTLRSHPLKLLRPKLTPEMEQRGLSAPFETPEEYLRTKEATVS